MRRRRQQEEAVGINGVGRLTGAISRNPREFVGIVMATTALFAVFTNALFLQKGPHPAPILITRPLIKQAPIPPQRPVAAQPSSPSEAAAQNRPQLIADIQRELSRKGFYDGAADGIWGAKTDAASRDFIQSAGAKINPDASPALLQVIVASKAKAPVGRAADAPRNDAIAELIAPSKRILAIQRALADFGYGQITLTGVYDPETRDAIEKFERDRRLPVTGQISDRFVREFAAMTGRPLE